MVNLNSKEFLEFLEILYRNSMLSSSVMFSLGPPSRRFNRTALENSVLVLEHITLIHPACARPPPVLVELHRELESDTCVLRENIPEVGNAT